MLNCNLMICELHYDRFVYAVIYIYWWICDLLSIVIIASLMSRLNFLLSIDPSSKWMITITSWWLNGYAQILLPSSINIVVTILLLCRLTIFSLLFSLFKINRLRIVEIGLSDTKQYGCWSSFNFYFPQKKWKPIICWFVYQNPFYDCMTFQFWCKPYFVVRIILFVWVFMVFEVSGAVLSLDIISNACNALAYLTVDFSW